MTVMLWSILLGAATAQSLYERPENSALAPFYQKVLDLGWTEVISSPSTCNLALERAANIVEEMTRKRPELRQRLQQQQVRISIIGRRQKLTDIPEHSDLETAFPKFPWNQRRGVGPTKERPVTSCAEENLLQLSSDPYRGQCILVHEFAHALMDMALEPEFVERIRHAYSRAMSHGLWTRTYAATDAKEYWAEGAADWFDCNRQSIPSDGIHNEINTQEELREYDPQLAYLLSQVFDSDLCWDRKILVERVP